MTQMNLPVMALFQDVEGSIDLQPLLMKMSKVSKEWNKMTQSNMIGMVQYDNVSVVMLYVSQSKVSMEFDLILDKLYLD